MSGKPSGQWPPLVKPWMRALDARHRGLDGIGRAPSVRASSHGCTRCGVSADGVHRNRCRRLAENAPMIRFCGGLGRGGGRVCGRGRVLWPWPSAVRNRLVRSMDDRSTISNVVNIRRPACHVWSRDAVVKSFPGSRIRGIRHGHAAPIALPELPDCGEPVAGSGFRDRGLHDRPRRSAPTADRPTRYDFRHSSQ